MPSHPSIFRAICWTVLLVWLVVMVQQTVKPLPPGVSVASAATVMHESQIEFLYDLTTHDSVGRPIVEQQIFDAVLAAIDGANTFIVLDFFLFNDDMGAVGDNAKGRLRPLSRELTDRLLARKAAVPDLQVLFITDPINDFYGSRPSLLLAELERSGVHIVRTDLKRLRASNPAYTSLWLMFAQWFGNSPGGTLPDPFREDGKASIRSWLALANFRANHRKVIVADTTDGDWLGIVTSGNPHDASSLHSNVAWRFRGDLAQAALESELEVARFSGWQGSIETGKRSRPTINAPATLTANHVTEEAIREGLLGSIAKAASGDEITLAMFYLADRTVIDALLDASQRGAHVRLILDPNKEAFGLEKDGVPNRPVATELIEKSGGKIEVRWYRTQGEQFHTKLAMVKTASQLTASLGSANLTRRNLGNYNLEANLQVAIPIDSQLARQLKEYFDLLWHNDREKGIEYTASFEAYRDESKLKYWRYRIMEATGLSTF